MKEIEIPNDSQLQVIGKYAFAKTSLKCFIVPFYLKKIEKCAFYCCESLQIIEINNEAEIELVDDDAFEYCDNCIVMISSKLIGCFNFNK